MTSRDVSSIRSQSSSWEIYGGQCGDWIVFLPVITLSPFNVGRDSSVGIDIVLAGRFGDRISVGGRDFSAPTQTCPGAHPAYSTMGTGSFQGLRRPGRGVDHSSQSNSEVKERIEVQLYFQSGSAWPALW